jgi:hypothetical protein
MATQFVVRSQGHRRPLQLKTLLYDGVEIVRVRENGIAIFDIVDPDDDVILELVIKRKHSSSAAVDIDGVDAAETQPAVATPKASSDKKKRARKKPSPDKQINIDKSAWNRRYNELVEHKKQTGHCRVSQKTNPSLARWVDLNCVRRHEHLSKEQTIKLQNLGLTLGCTVRQDTWNERYNELVVYKTQHGTCLVPKSYKEAPKLANWVDSMRKMFTEGNLQKERIKKLNELGFSWNALESKWHIRYNELLQYKQEYGDCKVPQKWERNTPLGEWVVVQRRLFQTGRLSEERIAKLNEIEFTWKMRTRRSGADKNDGSMLHDCDEGTM